MFTKYVNNSCSWILFTTLNKTLVCIFHFSFLNICLQHMIWWKWQCCNHQKISPCKSNFLARATLLYKSLFYSSIHKFFIGFWLVENRNVTLSRRSLRWISSTKPTHRLEQENQTNNGWLSWAIPHWVILNQLILIWKHPPPPPAVIGLYLLIGKIQCFKPMFCFVFVFSGNKVSP